MDGNNFARHPVKEADLNQGTSKGKRFHLWPPSLLDLFGICYLVINEIVTIGQLVKHSHRKTNRSQVQYHLPQAALGKASSSIGIKKA